MNRYEQHLYARNLPPSALFQYFLMHWESATERNEGEFYGNLSLLNQFRDNTRSPNDGHAYSSRYIWDRYNSIVEREWRDGLSPKLQSIRYQIAKHRADVIYAKLCDPIPGDFSIHDACFWCEAQKEEIEFQRRLKKLAGHKKAGEA